MSQGGSRGGALGARAPLSVTKKKRFRMELNTNVISINTQVIIQNRALSLARYLGLSADNHLDGQNGRQ